MDHSGHRPGRLARAPEEGAAARLLDKVRHGGAGSWGSLPMPPNPDLPAKDAKALLAWILEDAKQACPAL